jgi:hypothetical protein
VPGIANHAFLKYHEDVETEDEKILNHISDTLDEVLKILKKPVSRVGRILETAGAVVSVLSILSIIEILRNWFGG